MIVTTFKCTCYFCSSQKEHPPSHERSFELMSTLPSDEADKPGPRMEYCTLCGHERKKEDTSGQRV